MDTSFVEKMRKLKRAGIANTQPLRQTEDSWDETDTLNERISKVLNLFNNSSHNAGTMIYFIMYDIENDKIRTRIAKFLINKGCTRVQKSIFLAETPRKLFDEIFQTLKEVQEVYDNHDSIFFVPVSVDELRSMKIVGQNIDFDLVTGNRNVLFF